MQSIEDGVEGGREQKISIHESEKVCKPIGERDWV